MSKQSVEVPGGRLSVDVRGEGPPIVLLHANIADSRSWARLTPWLTAADYQVVAFDRRGFGDSTTEDVAFSYQADTIAVLDALGLGRAVLVGNSMGGRVAINTAVEFPERIAALILVGSGVGGWEPPVTPEDQAYLDELDTIEEAGDPDAIVEADVAAWVNGPRQPADRVDTDIQELVRTMDRPLADPDRVWGQPTRLEPPAAERLDRLTMPVLALAGALDFSDAIATTDLLAAHAPDARALVRPDVAHLIALEAPAALAGHIIEFLAPLPRWQ
jgi:pimeloyl-ACP methyl ester carboxylesterase